jgi:hypothetical protein
VRVVVKVKYLTRPSVVCGDERLVEDAKTVVEGPALLGNCGSSLDDSNTCPAVYMGMVYKHTCGRTGEHTVHKCSKEHCAVEWVDGAVYSQLSDNGQPEHK